MEPRYHQLEFEVRVYLTHLETSGVRLWELAGAPFAASGGNPHFFRPC
jgi:hypothetical protein